VISTPRGLIIGQNGHHFKRITETTGCLYIFMIYDNSIEIWGSYDSVIRAQFEIVRHLCNMHIN